MPPKQPIKSRGKLEAMTISDKKSRSSTNKTALLWPRVNPEGDIRTGAQREKPSDNKNEAPTEPLLAPQG